MNTRKAYTDLDKAYDFFNKVLWKGTLPKVFITMQTGAKFYGYFRNSSYSDKTGQHTDEIALNPDHFLNRNTPMILGTLVHEMCHVWQQHNGKPTRNGYHNKQWGTEMKRIGLYPSSTGQAGGKETGQKVSHYFIVGGDFLKHATKFIKQNGEINYGRNADAAKEAKKRTPSKIKYTCPLCDQNAWGKPASYLLCGDCTENENGEILIKMLAELPEAADQD